MPERRSDFALAAAIREPGFSPRRSDVPELFELLASDEVSARHAERALSSLGKSIRDQVLASFESSAPPLRGRLCRLIGRLARKDPGEWAPVLVACSSDADPKTLRNLANRTGGESFFPERLAEVRSLCERIALTMRNQYTLSYSPPSVDTKPTYHRIEVKVKDPKNRKLTVRTRTGYYTTPAPPLE